MTVVCGARRNGKIPARSPHCRVALLQWRMEQCVQYTSNSRAACRCMRPREATRGAGGAEHAEGDIQTGALVVKSAE